jgi:hypothetical protein
VTFYGDIEKKIIINMNKNKNKKNNNKHKNKPINVLKVARPPAISGKGAYTIAGMSTAGLAGKAGGMLGSYLGGPLGGTLGSALGNIFGSITGLGSYKVNTNSLVSQNSVPVFKNSANGCIEIIHREFLSDVSGSVGFVNTSYAINAGLLATFPFLAQLAANYEQADYMGLIFEFKTTCATAVGSTNTALGTVILATEYDVLDSNFTTKQQMEAYEFSCSTVPCGSVIHPVECDPRQNVLTNLYTRNGSIPAGADQRFYDLGNFQIATVGMQAANVIGELWVSYHVKLLKPKLSPPIGSATIQANTSISTTSIWGTAPLFTGTYAPSVVNVSSNVGTYTVTNLIIGVEYYSSVMIAGTVITGLAYSGLVGGTVVTQFNNLLQGSALSAGASSSFKATAATATQTISIASTTTTLVELVFCAVNPTPGF